MPHQAVHAAASGGVTQLHSWIVAGHCHQAVAAGKRGHAHTKDAIAEFEFACNRLLIGVPDLHCMDTDQILDAVEPIACGCDRSTEWQLQMQTEIKQCTKPVPASCRSIFFAIVADQASTQEAPHLHGCSTCLCTLTLTVQSEEHDTNSPVSMG